MSLLTAKDVAKILNVRTPRVYELVREHGLPAIPLGERQLRFDEKKLRQWLGLDYNSQPSEINKPIESDSNAAKAQVSQFDSVSA